MLRAISQISTECRVFAVGDYLSRSPSPPVSPSSNVSL